MPAKDPIVAIACILFGSQEATLPSMGNAAFAQNEEDEDGMADANLELDMSDAQPQAKLEASMSGQEKVC